MFFKIGGALKNYANFAGKNLAGLLQVANFYKNLEC